MAIKVLMLAQTFEPARGGGPRWTSELARGLAERGNSVLVITHDIEGLRGTFTPQPRLEIRYSPMFKIRGAPIFTPRTLIDAAREFNPDVVQTSAPSLSDVLLPPSRLIGAPYVTMFHAQYGASIPAKLLQSVNLLRLRRGEWARVSVSSDYWRQWLLGRGIDERIIEIIPSVVAREFSERVPGIEREVGHLLFVGGLADVQSYKRFDLLIDACKLLAQNSERPWRVSVVGDGNLRPEYERKVREAGLSERISFLGGIEDSELHRLYSAVSATVLPSSDPREGWGVVLAEALCCGSRIVLTDGIGGTNTFASAPGAIVVRAGSARSLSEGMHEIIERGADGKDDERARFGSQFHAASVVEQFEAMYLRAVAR